MRSCPLGRRVYCSLRRGGQIIIKTNPSKGVSHTQSHTATQANSIITVHTLGFGFGYTGVGLGRILEGVLWHDRRAFVCCCGRIGGWTPAYPDAAGDEYDMRI